MIYHDNFLLQYIIFSSSSTGKVSMSKPSLASSSRNALGIVWLRPTLCSEGFPVPTQDVESFKVHYNILQHTQETRVQQVIQSYSPNACDPLCLYTLQNLALNSIYEIRVQGVNRNGDGELSESLIATTGMLSFFKMYLDTCV